MRRNTAKVMPIAVAMRLRRGYGKFFAGCVAGATRMARDCSTV
jgi:hypothetical protein